MGLTIAAAITTAVVIALYGFIIVRMSAPVDRPIILLAGLVALPLQPLAFYLIRMPLHGWLTTTLGAGALLTTLTLVYAPLTEEPAKWLPLLVPPVRRRLRPDNAAALALAVGLGFGIGEIWFLAQQLSHLPALAALPFYAFGGFMVERILVCFLHGGFIVFAYHRLAAGRSFFVGGLIGMVLHFAVNIPIYFAAIDLFGIGKLAWQVILTFWASAFVIGLGIAMSRLSRGRFRDIVLGYSTCPECQTVYPRSLFAINLGPVRYERCPNCRHFHWVKVMSGPRTG